MHKQLDMDSAWIKLVAISLGNLKASLVFLSFFVIKLTTVNLMSLSYQQPGKICLFQQYQRLGYSCLANG